jgi:hypothetical protein
MNGIMMQTDFASKVSKIEKDFTLTTVDRCDRCGAQAYVQVKLIKDGELMFCNHHYKTKEASLLPLPQVLTVRDESGRLLIKPTPSDD